MNKKTTESLSDRKQFETFKKEYKRFWDLRPEYHQIVIRKKYDTEEKRFVAWLINIKFKEWLESKRLDDKRKVLNQFGIFNERIKKYINSSTISFAETDVNIEFIERKQEIESIFNGGGE